MGIGSGCECEREGQGGIGLSAVNRVRSVWGKRKRILMSEILKAGLGACNHSIAIVFQILY